MFIVNVYLEILRLSTVIMAVGTVFLMMLISGNFTLDALLAAGVVFTITGAGNVINDYFDYRIDIINKPKRSIPSGRISRIKARNYALLLFMVGCAAALLIDFLMGMITFLVSVSLFYYSYALKRKVLIGNICVAFINGVCFVFGGLVVDMVLLSVYFGICAFLVTMAREIVKDIEDIKGDKKEGAITLPIRYGTKNSSIIAASLLLTASISSPLLYFTSIFNLMYLAILLVAIILFTIGAIIILMNQSVGNARRASKMIKMGMLVIVSALIIGLIHI